MSSRLNRKLSVVSRTESSSARSGADFSLKDVDGWMPELEGREAFPRDSNGLIDIEKAYAEFLVDDPDIIPTQITEDMLEEWVHQHEYFRRLFYLQKSEPDIMRDRVLSRFREEPYNQLAMRPRQELAAHQKYARKVSPPPVETMKKSLIDFKVMDRLGAAAIGRRVALVPEALGHLIPKCTPKKGKAEYSPFQKARFFDKEMEKAIEVLYNPLVTPQRVVTGAIARMARMLNNERLLEEARRRIDIDPVYYPVRIRKPGFLYDLSNTMLKNIQVVYLPSAEDRPEEVDLQTRLYLVESSA